MSYPGAIRMRDLDGVRLPRIVGKRAERERMAARIAELEAMVADLRRSIVKMEGRHARELARVRTEERRKAPGNAPPPSNVREARDTVYGVVAQASAATGIAADAILGPSRVAEIAAGRLWAYFEARQAGLTLQQIAQVFGRHHTTVHHGIRQEAERRRQNG